MYESELVALVGKYPQYRRYFLGVYSIDQVENCNFVPCSFAIVNTDPSGILCIHAMVLHHVIENLTFIFRIKRRSLVLHFGAEHQQVRGCGLAWNEPRLCKGQFPVDAAEFFV